MSTGSQLSPGEIGATRSAQHGEIDAVVPSSAKVRRVTQMPWVRTYRQLGEKRTEDVLTLRLQEFVFEQALVKDVTSVGLHNKQDVCTKSWHGNSVGRREKGAWMADPGTSGGLPGETGGR
jgi:hypothetical protein